MLRIQFSNRYEALLDALVERLGRAPSLFAAEQVVVPSAALRRSVTLALAERDGICCNVEFSFLAQWLWRQIARVLPAVGAESPFDAAVLGWRIHEIFGDADFVAAQPRLAEYLGRADPTMRLALAQRSAALLEQYLTYRPDWLAAWSAHEAVDLGTREPLALADERWQAALWRRIAAELGAAARHPAQAFVDALEHAPPGRLPQQLHVFCLPAMPPLYTQLLQRLGRWVDVTLYVLNPCREYWFELVDRKRLAHLALRGAAAHHEVGNRLLAGWGRQTQAQIELLLEAADDAIVDDAGFAASAEPTLLGRLQNAVLDLVELEPAALAKGDRSIEVHACHTLTRELEVLHDRLLGCFAADATLEPSEILVVTPDLEAAAPLIDAVFGNVPRARAIPYSITGRPRSSVNGSARALLGLLALLGSRFEASRVFELLQMPIVGRRFGLEGDALDAVRRWLQQAGIRWGLDGAHRAGFDLPAVERHSFDDGLQRLYLGYALPSGVDEPFLGRLPAGDAEGSAAVALGAFGRAMALLERWQRELAVPQTPDAWCASLAAVLEQWLAPVGDEVDERREVQAALRQWHEHTTAAQACSPLPLAVVRTALQKGLDDAAHGGVPEGAVTFAAIGSLRGLPYRIVCAIGLNDGVFPSTTRPAEFDLMALRPRRGDRQRRDDERNLFLDLLLAAREQLHLSYCGRSVRDNAPLPPSVLVSELLDCLVAATAADDSAAARAAARARLVVAHPLQPFSADAYRADADPRLRSHNEEYAEALQRQVEARADAETHAAARADVDTHALTEGRSFMRSGEAGDDADADGDDERDLPAWAPPFFTQPLEAAGAEWRSVSLEQLVSFFRNPSRYLLKRRLGITLARDADDLDDDEPFLPDYHARKALAERLLPRMLEGNSGAALRTLAQAGGEYPAGPVGERLLERELLGLERFAQSLCAASAEPTCPPHTASLIFDLHGETWRLDAAFADLRTSGVLRHRYDALRPTDRIEAWLAHLVLCAAPPPGVALQTRWHARDEILVLQRAPHAEAALRELLLLYRTGLTRPLHFFPKAAWRYVDHDADLRAAALAWETTPYARGEDRDPAYQLALRGVAAPLDDEFEHAAQAVFGTMQACLQPAGDADGMAP